MNSLDSGLQLGWRQLGWRPFVVGWRPSLLYRLEAIAHSRLQTTDVEAQGPRGVHFRAEKGAVSRNDSGKPNLDAEQLSKLQETCRHVAVGV